MSAEEDNLPEAEVVEERGLELRRPTTPTTINELAALDASRGKAIVESRTSILNVLRVASIQLTMPQDWTLFRVTDERGETIKGFLGDAGADRIKKLWGIQIDNLSAVEMIDDPTTGEFAARITGDGHCGMTGESVFDIEGVRYSTERYAEEKPEGIQRRVAVRKAARANLDGSIVRELTGMKEIPIQELDAAWSGTWKKSELSNKGRGFGSKDQRLGHSDAKTGEIDPGDIPICEVCKTKLVFRAKGNPPFWGCSTYAKHPEVKVVINHDTLVKQIADRRKASEAANKAVNGDKQ